MANLLVEQLMQGAKDASGVDVLAVYAKNKPVYAVYRTNSRVTIHFSDDPDQAEKQRATLAPLGPLRSEIAGLIDGWRNAKHERERAKAERFDRRVADAIVIALQGDSTGALLLLQTVRDDIIADRKSWARFQYLIVAASTAGITLVVLFLLSSKWFGETFTLYAGVKLIWLSAGGGTMGAVFSIATGMRSRTILTDLHWRDNACDALLRVVIGVIAAALIICLFQSKTISYLKFDDAALHLGKSGDPYGWMQIVVIGFVAGFSERLVPDLLAKAGIGIDPAAADTAERAKAGQEVAAATATAAAAGRAPAPDAAEPLATDELHDNCLCDEAPDPAETTDDADLPPAAGGIEEAMAKAA